jgi:hypothetical protein
MSIRIEFYNESYHRDVKDVTLSELANFTGSKTVTSLTIPTSSLVQELLDSITTTPPIDLKHALLIVVAGHDDGELFPSLGNMILRKINAMKIRFERIRFNQYLENTFVYRYEIIYDNCIFENESVCPIGTTIRLESCTLQDDSISDELVRSSAGTVVLTITGLNNMSLRRIHLQYPDLKLLFLNVEQMSRPIDVTGILQCSKLESLHIGTDSSVLRENIETIPTVAMPKLTEFKLDQADRYTSSWIAKKMLQPKLYNQLTFALFPGAFTASELMDIVGVSADSISLDIWDPDVPSNFLVKITSLFRNTLINFMVQPRAPFEIPNLSILKSRGSTLNLFGTDVYAFWGNQFKLSNFYGFNLHSLSCPQTPEWAEGLYNEPYDKFIMPRKVDKKTVPPLVYEQIPKMIRPRVKRPYNTELGSLFDNDEEKIKAVTVRRYHEVAVSHTQSFTDADNVKFLEEFEQHTGNDYADNDSRIPEIFHELHIWTKRLSDDQKRAIFYYTTGHAPRQFNQVIAKKTGAVPLSPHQLIYLHTLLRVFQSSPKTQTAFRVFRGFPHELDGGLFNSASTEQSVANQFLLDSAILKKGHITNPLGVKTGTCCMHVILVKPGAHVLHIPNQMKQISSYSESEVLFAPFMGQFVQSEPSNIVEGRHTMYWSYEPYSDERISENLLSFISESTVPTQSRKSSRIAMQEGIGRVALNVRHPGGLHHGSEVIILKPHVPSTFSTYRNSLQIATFIPGQTGVPRNALTASEPFLDVVSQESFARNFQQNRDILVGQVPPQTPVVSDKGNWGAGLIIFEPDGRVWIAHPTNGFGGDRATFPRGTYDDLDMTDLRITAVREVFEETGIFGAIVAYVANPLISAASDARKTAWMRGLNEGSGVFAEVFQDGHKRVRYYLARRIAGSPIGTGWESQAVSLVPLFKLRELKVGVRLLDDNSEESNGDNVLVDFLLDPSVQARIIRSYGAGYFTAPLVSIGPIAVGAGGASAGAGGAGMVSFGKFVRRYMQKHQNKHTEYTEYRAKLKYNKALHMFFTNRL